MKPLLACCAVMMMATAMHGEEAATRPQTFEGHLEAARALETSLATLEAEAYARAREKGEYGYLAEDREKLAALRKERDAHYTKALKLAPEREVAAWEKFGEANKLKGGTYDEIRELLTHSDEYVRSFPTAARARGMYEHQGWAYANLARFLQQFKAGELGTPADLDSKETKRLLLALVKLQCAYIDRFVDVPKRRDDGSWNHERNIHAHLAYNLERLFEIGVTPEEWVEVLAAYRRAAMLRPKKLAPHDFLQLRYLARQKDAKGYLALLEELQKRWPDPNDVHWSVAKDEVLETVSELLESDRRTTAFYRFLKGSAKAK